MGENIGLSEGVTYFVSVVDENTIKLKANPGSTTFINVAPTASQGTQALYKLDRFDLATEVNNVGEYHQT